MPIDFSHDEKVALIDLLVDTMERHPFPLSQRIQLLRRILMKLRPAPPLPPDDDDEMGDDAGVQKPGFNGPGALLRVGP